MARSPSVPYFFRKTLWLPFSLSLVNCNILNSYFYWAKPYVPPILFNYLFNCINNCLIIYLFNVSRSFYFVNNCLITYLFNVPQPFYFYFLNSYRTISSSSLGCFFLGHVLNSLWISSVFTLPDFQLFLVTLIFSIERTVNSICFWWAGGR